MIDDDDVDQEHDPMSFCIRGTLTEIFKQNI